MPQVPFTVMGRPVTDSQNILPNGSIELGVLANSVNVERVVLARSDSVDLLPAETATNRPSASSAALVATSTAWGAVWGALFCTVGYIINAANHHSAPDHTQNWYWANFILQATGVGTVAGAAAGAVAGVVVVAGAGADCFVKRFRTRSNPTDGSGIDESTPFTSVFPTSSSSAGNRGL